MQESDSPATRVYESRLPQPLVRLKRWLVAHHMTLITIADTPHSIALGSAIGIFFGFTPLWSLKTLLSIVIAWICRCNKIAAAIAVTRLVDVVSSRAGPRAFWAFRIARLSELAPLFANRLARVGRFAFPGSAVRFDCLFFDTLAA